MIYSLVALAFVFIAGMCRAARTCRTDLGKDTPLYYWAVRHGWEDWYLGTGGNSRWNPSLPSLPGVFWSGDFWHSATSYFSWSFCIAIGVASMAGLNLWQAALLAYFGQWVEGLTFIIYYHNVCAIIRVIRCGR